jgi:NADPH:quinone reductase-like Zn-dependent oxidoreductase
MCERVGWFRGGQGSFAEFAVVAAGMAVSTPDEVDDQRAMAVLMQGVTAHYLASDTVPISAGDAVLVHSAAGGFGCMLTQIAKIRGATVLGTVSTDEKAEAAREAGADHTFSYNAFAPGYARSPAATVFAPSSTVSARAPSMAASRPSAFAGRSWSMAPLVALCPPSTSGDSTAEVRST